MQSDGTESVHHSPRTECVDCSAETVLLVNVLFFKFLFSLIVTYTVRFQ